MVGPRYEPGKTIHFSYSKTADKLPATIYIEAVYRKVKSDQWMYSVINQSGVETYMGEKFISDMMTRHSAQVYKTDVVKSYMADGLLFAGNRKTDEAVEFGRKIARQRNDIDKIILYPALNERGIPVEGEHGMWIRYKEHTKVLQENTDGSIIIK